MTDQLYDVGFVGLGNMGAPMVARLVAAGQRVIVTDVRSDVIDEAVRGGAAGAASPAEIAAAVPLVLLSLPTPAVVEAVVLGPGGLIEGRAMRTCVDLSTTGPAMAERIAAALEVQGVAMVDAPVSGGVSGAVAGTLTLMLAGDPTVIAAVDPILAHIGAKRVVVGTIPGQGQIMKLLNNMLSATAFAATSEALVLGRQAGLDTTTMLDVFNSSSGRNNATADKFPKYVLPRTFDFGFGLGLMAKDVGLYAAEAQRRRLPSLIGSATANVFGLAVAEGMGALDSTALVQLLERWGGVTVEGPVPEQHGDN